MAEFNCSACEALRQEAPDFVVNGITDDTCASLMNNTGLNPSNDFNDCHDLNNINDCLVGNMENEVDAYDVCDWKPFMKMFIPNIWTMFQAIICAICGLWGNTNIDLSKIQCVYDGLYDLANSISSTVGGRSFVRYFRDNSGQTGSQYYWSATTNSSHTLDIYMDASVDDPGTQEADRDYVVMISNCTDMAAPAKLVLDVTYYSSGETDTLENLRKRRAQHPTYNGSKISELSWTTSGAVLVKQGEHIKVNAYVVSAGGSSNAQFRLHQFVLTWIPVNVSSPLDPSSVLPDCGLDEAQ